MKMDRSYLSVTIYIISLNYLLEVLVAFVVDGQSSYVQESSRVAISARDIRLV